MGRIYLSNADGDEWIVVSDDLRVQTFTATLPSDSTDDKGAEQFGVKQRSVELTANGLKLLKVTINGTNEKLMPGNVKSRAFNLKRKLADRIDEAEAQLATNGNKSVIIVPDSTNQSFTIHPVAEIFDNP